MSAVIFATLVTQKGLDLTNFLSNFGAKNMAEMEVIEKVERKTIGSMVKKANLEEVRNISMEIVVHYILYSMDSKKNLEAYPVVVASRASWTQ